MCFCAGATAVPEAGEPESKRPRISESSHPTSINGGAGEPALGGLDRLINLRLLVLSRNMLTGKADTPHWLLVNMLTGEADTPHWLLVNVAAVVLLTYLSLISFIP